MYDIASIFNEAYIEVPMVDKAVSGFRKVRILLFNPEKITEHDFIPEAAIQPLVISVLDNVNNLTTREIDW